MADTAKLERALVNADRAGDVEGARKLAAAIKAARSGETETYDRRVQRRAEAVRRSQGNFGAFVNRSSDLIGLNDEVAGAAEVIGNAIKAPFRKDVDFDPAGSFRFGRDVYKAEQRMLEESAPLAAGVGTGVSIATGVALPTKSLAGSQGLGRIAKQAGTQGAVMGSLAGFANAEGGLGQRVLSSGLGALGGGVLGAAIPVAARGLGATYRGVAGMFGKGPQAAAPKMIADAIRADGLSPAALGQGIGEAQARGVPLALMDMGDNLRGLAASVGRKPGPSRTIIRDAAISRQEGQVDRIAGAVARDLGPVANPREVGEQLMASAKQKAAPLYEQAYATPTPVTDNLAGILKRVPRAAYESAMRIARLEGRDPNAVRLDFDDAGQPILGNQLSMETLDLIKRGLDDVVEKYRDKTTGRLVLDTEGRAVNNLLRAFTSEVDRVNPAYAQARAAYAGDAKMAEALNRGRNVLNKTADDLTVMTRDMTPAELDQFRLGVRAAMVRAMEGRGDYADKVRQLVGTPQKRAALEKLFGGKGDFNRFMATLASEARAQQTSAAVATGSPTAGRLADDATTTDAGLLAGAADVALNGVSGTAGMIATLRRALSEARDYGVGKIGNEVREQLAAVLSETDPAILERALREAKRARASRVVQQAPRNRAAVSASRGAGIASGQAVGALSVPQE